MSFKISHVRTMCEVIGYVKEKRSDTFDAAGSLVKTSKFKEIWCAFAPKHNAPAAPPAAVVKKIEASWGMVDLKLWPLDTAMDLDDMAIDATSNLSIDPTRSIGQYVAPSAPIDVEKLAEQHEIRVSTLEEMIVELDTARNANDAAFIFVSGDAGFGKTHTVLSSITALENCKFEVVAGAVLTDIGLFELFERNCEMSNIVVLDDVTLSMSAKCLNMLKGAMQTKASLRTIEWITADGVRKVHFHGSIIWLANEKLSSIRAAKSASLNAVMSRFPTVIDLSIPLQARLPLVKSAIQHGLLSKMGMHLAFTDDQCETVTEIIVDRLEREPATKVNFRLAENLLRTAMRLLTFDDGGLITESLDKFEKRLSVNSAIELS